MPKSRAFDLIETGRGYGFKLLVLSGGEALYYFNDIQEIIKCSAKLGYSVWVETNAYWAGSRSLAREKVSLLKRAGVAQLVISTDLFHLPFVPLDRVIWAIQAAEEVGVGYHIDVTRSGNPGEDSKITASLRLLGVEPGYWDPIPFGRGKYLAKNLFKQYRHSEVPACDGLCLAIDPLGNCSCCCNFRVHENGSKLNLGNIYRHDFEHIIKGFQHSPYLEFVNAGGLREIPLVNGALTYTDVCDVCCRVFNDAYIMKEVDRWCTQRMRKTYERCITD